jgi:hypothetical protein
LLWTSVECGRERDSGSKAGKTAAVKMLCGACGLAILIAVVMVKAS